MNRLLLLSALLLPLVSCARPAGNEPTPLSLARLVAWPALPERPVYVLVAGVAPEYVAHHTRAPDDFGGLTDTLLLVRIDPAGETVKILSVPRDTRVGRAKINSFLKTGGPDAMVKAVSDLTGLPVHGVVMLDTRAAQAVTDAVGGVVVNVPVRMRYRDTAAGLDIDLQPGEQRLNGTQAEGFVRYRGDGRGDIGRVERQQVFLKALTTELVQPRTLLRLPALNSVLVDHTRSDLTRPQIGHLLGVALRRPVLETFMVPGRFALIDRMSFWEADRPALRTLVDRELR